MFDCIWIDLHLSALYFIIFYIFEEQDLREKDCKHMKKTATSEQCIRCQKIFAPIALLFLQLFLHVCIVNMCAIDLTVNWGRLEEN